MSELRTVEISIGPVSVGSLADDLAALGVLPGMTLLTHSSLSALGWVCGGAQAVVLALTQALAETGTLMMPTHSGGLSNPADWQAPPVPKSWWQTIRREMPAFDPRLTPTRQMGAIVDCFRGMQDARRSSHPQVSFAARGPQAQRLTERHPLAPGMGDSSPLGGLYELDGWVLLLGVGHDRNSSLHLAEHRASYPGKRECNQASPIMVEGRRTWRVFRDLECNTDDFTAIGDAFGGGVRGRVGVGRASLFRQRELVDFAVDWMEAHRA